MHRKYFCEDCPDKEEGCQSGCYNYELVPSSRKDRLDLSIYNFEKETGIKLMPCQKEMLDEVFEKDVIIPPRHSGETHVKTLMALAHWILFRGKDK
jgi:hypothetical protein